MAQNKDTMTAQTTDSTNSRRYGQTYDPIRTKSCIMQSFAVSFLQHLGFKKGSGTNRQMA
jgi:hypothetical protein